MADEIVPRRGTPNWLDQLNLPKLIAGPAGEALSRLIAGAADIPVALLEEITADIRNRTAGKKKVSQAIADGLAEASRSDPALIERAKSSLLAKELRRQANKEAIAQEAIEHLKDEPRPGEHPASPDDDWLNVFEQYAEQASSEKLQNLWARVLAGEIRRPKSFSLRTLRFISELDQETAQLFEKYADAIIDNNFIPRPSGENQDLSDLIQLQNCGLVAEVASMVRKNFNIPAEGVCFQIAGRWVRLTGMEGARVSIPAVVVTTVGKEIASILKKTFSRTRLEEFAACVPKGNLDKIELGLALPSAKGLVFVPQETVWRRAE